MTQKLHSNYGIALTRTTIEITREEIIEAVVNYLQQHGFVLDAGKRFLWEPYSSGDNYIFGIDKEHKVPLTGDLIRKGKQNK